MPTVTIIKSSSLTMQGCQFVLKFTGLELSGNLSFVARIVQLELGNKP